jgi:hypothetical protein
MENLNNRIDLVADLGVHFLILFIFLTSFFLLYVSKLEQENLNSQLNTIIEKNLGDVVRTNKYKFKEVFGDIIDEIPYEKLKRQYKTADDYQQLNNDWLKKSLFITNLFLFLIITFSILLIKKICNIDLDVKHILKINLFTFIGIGIVEYLFFTHVALKYIPTSPSLIVESILNNTKNYLS